MMVRALKTAPTRILVRPTLRRGKIEAHNSCLLAHTEYAGSATIRGRGLHSAGAYTSTRSLNRFSARSRLAWILPQPRLACADDGLRPVGHLQLEEDV
jgi:hypothetical protein